ncbi:MAG: hypothetical protein ABI999_06620 [Acidobacteriota bacterium]
MRLFVGDPSFPVFKFVRTFSFVRLNWLRFFAVHIRAAVVFSMAQLGIYDLIDQILFHGGGRGFIEYYGFLLANEFQSSFLVYFAVIAAINAERMERALSRTWQSAL